MTNSDIKPRRTMLYVPASNSRAMAKAMDLPVDMVAFDLEDSVAPDAKDAARQGLTEHLAQNEFGTRDVLVRVNGLDTPWIADDLAALAGSDIGGVLLPKVGGPEEVEHAIAGLGEAGRAVRIWCMIETPAAVLGADRIAAASDRVAGFAVGLNDLGRELQARQTPDRAAFLTSLGMIVLAARAHGLAAIDSPYMDINNSDGMRAHCELGRTMGFDGCSVIHPGQVEIANRSYSPSAGDIVAAQRIIDVHAAAIADGKGVTVLDGRLVENLHVAEAQRVLALAEAVGD